MPTPTPEKPETKTPEPKLPAAKTPAAAKPGDAIVTLIVRPERMRPPRTGPIRLPVPPHTDNTDGKVEMALQGEFMAAGTCFITQAQFEVACQNQFWQFCQTLGVIEVVQPVAGVKATGTTLDFDLADAYELIEASVDIEWLRRSTAKDDRPEIGQWCGDRIKTIEAESQPEA